jgi:transcriptional regulator with XRE-family HTH domain
MRGVAVNGAMFLRARTQRGLTQEELARLARVDAKTIRKAEQGKRLDLIPLTRVARVLDTDVRLLILPNGSVPSHHEKLRNVVVTWSRAFDDCDMETLLALYHDDAVLRLPGGPNIPFGGMFQGKEEIRRAHELTWTSVRQVPISLEEMTILVSDEAVTLKAAKGCYTPSGELLRIPVMQIFTFSELLIIEHEVEYDTLDFSKRMPFPS